MTILMIHQQHLTILMILMIQQHPNDTSATSDYPNDTS